jgi:hypothetical protein
MTKQFLALLKKKFDMNGVKRRHLNSGMQNKNISYVPKIDTMKMNEKSVRP